MKSGVLNPATRFELAFLVAALAASMAVGIMLFDSYARSELSSTFTLTALLAALGLGLILVHFAPGLLVALVPATLVFNTTRGFFPFILVLLGLGAYSVLDALRRRDARLHGPPGLHLAYLAHWFAAALTILVASEFIPFIGGMVGLTADYIALAFVLRYAEGRMWKWFALSLPVTGTAIAFQVMHVALRRGFSVQNSFLLRSFFSNVGWGVSNYVGAVLSLTILGSFVLLVLSRRTALRLVCAVALLPMGIATALLVSRGTVVAVILGILLLLFVTRGSGRWRVLLLGGVGMVLFLKLPVTRVLLARFSPSQSGSLIERVHVWQLAWERFLSHPLLGVGLEQGRFQSDPLQNLNPHNYFLSVASEMGIVGLATWMVLLVALFVVPWRAARGSALARPWAAALTVLVGVAVVHSCYEPTFPGGQYHFLFFWVFAVLLQGVRRNAAEAAPEQAVT